MSSFIEFQAVVLDKLCSIENRLNNIEEALGIPQNIQQQCTDSAEEVQKIEETKAENSFKNEISSFQNELADIRSLFSVSDN